MKKRMAILSVALIATMAGMVVAPVLGQIKLAFPDASMTNVRLISTMHSLVIVPCLFISGWLTKRFSKKSILLVALVIYVIGGVGGASAHSVELILGFRAVLGIGVGLLMPISTTLVADFYEGDERSSMMGIVSGTQQFGGIIAFILAGILAAMSWRLPFAIYGIALISFFVVAMFLPKQPPLKEEKKVENSKLSKKIYLLGIGMAGVFLFMYTIPTNMAMYILEFNIAPPAAIGLLIACTSIGAMVAGMLYSKYKRVLSVYVAPIQILLMAVSFFIIVVSTNAYILAAGILLNGFSWGILIPLIYENVAAASDKTQMVKSMGLVQILMYLAQFLSPIFIGFITGLFGQTSTQFVYIVTAYMVAGVAVLAFIVTILKVNSVKSVNDNNV